MRKLISFGIVFVLLAGVMPVQAQVGLLGRGYRPSSMEGWWYYWQGDQAHMLLADNVNWVGETMDIGRRAQMRRVADDLTYYDGAYGLRGPRGFYPVVQCSKGQRIGKAIGATALSAILGAVIGGKKGAAIGAGVGGGFALYNDAKCWRAQNQMVVVDDPSDLQGMPGPMQPGPSMPAGRENGWNQRLRDQAMGGNPWFGSHRGCQEQGMFTLKNESGEAIRVFQNGKPFAVLQARQSECGDPFAEYEAEMVVAVSDGFTARAQVVRAKPEGRQGGIWVWR